MKGFIEVLDRCGKSHLVNINHIVEVKDSDIYTDDIMPFMNDFPCISCKESYYEIKDKIAKATRKKE